MKIITANNEILTTDKPVKIIIDNGGKPGDNIEYSTDDETLTIINFNDVKSEFLTNFMNKCLTDFEMQEKYFLTQSESDIENDILRMDLVNRKESYTHCKLFLKIIRDEFVKQIKSDKYE